jgi:hypothetical protein
MFTHPDLDTDDPGTYATEEAAVCVPTHDETSVDAVAWHGADLFGYSQNYLRGPRDCGGQRLDRSVTKDYGTGSCDLVADWSDAAHPIFWANELCARNPNMTFLNSQITQACQEFFNGGSDLGDHDCRYIVHIGGGPYVPPFQSANDTQCRPSHTTRVPEYCQPPPPSFSYSAANTNSATTNTADQTVVLDAGQTITLGTCGMPGSTFSGDTYLRLHAPLTFPFYGIPIAVNDDSCSGLGSRLVYTAIYGGNYTIRAGCYANTSCSGKVVWTVQ